MSKLKTKIKTKRLSATIKKITNDKFFLESWGNLTSLEKRIWKQILQYINSNDIKMLDSETIQYNSTFAKKHGFTLEEFQHLIFHLMKRCDYFKDRIGKEYVDYLIINYGKKEKYRIRYSECFSGVCQVWRMEK